MTKISVLIASVILSQGAMAGQMTAARSAVVVPALPGVTRVAPVVSLDLLANSGMFSPGIAAPVLAPAVVSVFSGAPVPVMSPGLSPVAAPAVEESAPGSLPALKSAVAAMPAEFSTDKVSAGLSKAFEGTRTMPSRDLGVAAGEAASGRMTLSAPETGVQIPFNGVKAYSFKSRLTLAKMAERLNAKGPYQWHRAESDSLGDYLVTRPFADLTRLRIVERDGEFVLDVMFASRDEDASARWESLRSDVRGKVLRTVMAKAVQSALSLD